MLPRIVKFPSLVTASTPVVPEDRAYAAAQRRAATMAPTYGCVNPECGNTSESALQIAWSGLDCRCCGGRMEPNL